jgi:hypothetical protein
MLKVVPTPYLSLKTALNGCSRNLGLLWGLPGKSMRLMIPVLLNSIR